MARHHEADVIVVAGHTNAAAGEAMQMSRLSDDVTLITNSHVDEIDETFANYYLYPPELKAG